MENNLFRTTTGFRRDEMYHIEEYDIKGIYLGQWQQDINGDGEIFIKPDRYNPVCGNLSESEMLLAR